jgi:hypothetical protein
MQGSARRTAGRQPFDPDIPCEFPGAGRRSGILGERQMVGTLKTPFFYNQDTDGPIRVRLPPGRNILGQLQTSPGTRRIPKMETFFSLRNGVVHGSTPQKIDITCCQFNGSGACKQAKIPV